MANESLHAVNKYSDPDYWQELKHRFDVPNFKPTDLIDVEYYLKNLSFREIALAVRNDEATIEGGGLPERLSKYLQMLIFLTGGPPSPIGLQFIAQPDKERGLVSANDIQAYTDSLIEDEHAVIPDVLIHKYDNRALMLVTSQCAAYCRYCTRGRLVGIEGARKPEELDEAFSYIANHPEIEEIIFSGGDSFVLPQALFGHLIDQTVKLEESGQLKSVRFGTRSIIHNPDILKDWHLEGLRRLIAPNVMLHYNHHDEMTKQVADAVKEIRQTGARLHSQGVLLQGVNDDRQVLKDTWVKGNKYGVTPYYLFLCDLVKWAGHFFVSPAKAGQLVYRLREEMGGLAGSARVVIDVPQGHGKIPLEEGFFIRPDIFEDFNHKKFLIKPSGDIIAVESIQEADAILENDRLSGEVMVYDSSQNS